MSLKKSKPPAIDFTRFELTDAGNGEMFAALLGDRVRFDHRQGRWLVWRNHRWERDKDGEVYRLGKELCRQRAEAAQTIEDKHIRQMETQWALRTESAHGMSTMLNAAKNELPVADAGEWDNLPMLLGVANGVVDLRTGTLRDGLPSDRITMQSPVAFDAGAQCPRWEQFLREVFENRNDMIRFIQRAVGYSFTGDIREQCFFLCQGVGSNGKTTLLEIIRFILGDYADATPFSTFERKPSANAPTNDQAKLQGCRFVTAVEPNEQVRFNEALLKLITGNDPITARFLHKEFFTFYPVCKVWMAFNHRPIVGDDSHGFWRRVRLIPFTAKFSAGNVDTELPARLRAEAPGILAWAVRGCMEWQQHGLGMPAAVELATRGYQQESSPVDVFIRECFILDSQEWLSSHQLWTMFQDWSRQNFDCHDLNRSQFSKRLKDRGLKPATRGHHNTRGWVGLKPAITPPVEP